MCSICKNDRCIGKYLLHPKEIIFISKIKEEELKANSGRSFILVDSPSSGEIFTKFKELHVIAGADEDINNPKEVKVDISTLSTDIIRAPIIISQYPPTNYSLGNENKKYRKDG